MNRSLLLIVFTMLAALVTDAVRADEDPVWELDHVTLDVGTDGKIQIRNDLNKSDSQSDLVKRHEKYKKTWEKILSDKNKEYESQYRQRVWNETKERLQPKTILVKKRSRNLSWKEWLFIGGFGALVSFANWYSENKEKGKKSKKAQLQK